MSNPDEAGLREAFRRQCMTAGPELAFMAWRMSGDLPNDVLVDILKEFDKTWWRRPMTTSDMSDGYHGGYHTLGELYDHRAALTAALTALLPDASWRSLQHHDGTMFEGMFIVGLSLPDVGQVSYHYEVKRWTDFDHVVTRECAPEFDGHTPFDVVVRLHEFAQLAGGF